MDSMLIKKLTKQLVSNQVKKIIFQLYPNLSISDSEELKKAQKRFKLETFDDFFQYYYLMIVFQYLYQYRIVRFLINDVLYSRKYHFLLKIQQVFSCSCDRSCLFINLDKRTAAFRVPFNFKINKSSIN